MIRYAFVCLLAAVGLWVAAARPAAAQGMAVPVRARQVKSVETEERRIVTGSLRAIRRASLASQEAGLVSTLNVKEGQHLKQGDVIIALDTRRLQLELTQAESEINRAEATQQQREAELLNAREELERRVSAASMAQGSVSGEELNRAQRLVDVAASAAQAARFEKEISDARRDVLKIRIGDAEIRAPFDGVVVSRHIEVGEWVNPGTPLVTLVSSGDMEATFEVPEQFPMDALQTEAEILVEMSSLGLRVPAASRRVVPDVDPRSRRYMLTLVIDPGKAALTPGMSVSAAIPTSARRAYLMVPSDALVQDAGGNFVYKAVANPDGSTIAMPVTVRVLFRMGDDVAVECPALMENDAVVVEGNERLRPMTPISLLPEGASK